MALFHLKVSVNQFENQIAVIYDSIFESYFYASTFKAVWMLLLLSLIYRHLFLEN